MRLGELLGSEVRDQAGRYVATVADVVLVQDGPIRGPYGASFRVSGLILVERRHVRLLGYERHVVPVLLRWLVKRLAGRVSYVEWGDVTRCEDGRFVLRVDPGTLPEHDPAYRRGA